MADVTNPEAIKFVNEQVRPLCEAIRALKVRIDSMQAAWSGGIGAVIGVSASDAIADGREAEGVSRLTAYDVASAHDALVYVAASLTPAIIEKPCVRPLRAE